VIGMTNLQEAKLAREAEICFASLAIVTDYDCWNPKAGSVEIGEVLRILQQNVELAKRSIANLGARVPTDRSCACARALEHAIVTRRDAIPAERLTELAPLIGRYFAAR
jgi:5'-methylthioadenosine phosphorylase